MADYKGLTKAVHWMSSSCFFTSLQYGGTLDFFMAIALHDAIDCLASTPISPELGAHLCIELVP